MADFVLPELRYAYDALEPHLSAETLELHHDKHHRSYVTGANETLAELDDVRQSDDFERIAGLERALAFHTSGHILHSLYWQNLSPDGGGEPRGELGASIDRDFGSFERFRKQMTQAAATTMGSGWAALVHEPVTGRLLVVQIHDHQNVTVQGALPLMVLDAWEHAYYAQYKASKEAYFEALWNIWNWEDIATRYLAATSADLMLTHAASDEREVPFRTPGMKPGETFDRL